MEENQPHQLQHLNGNMQSTQIPNTMDEIDMISPIALLKSPDLFKESFQTLYQIAHKSFKTQSYEKTIKAYTKCLDMLDIGKNIINQNNLGPYVKISIYNNVAYAHLNMNKLLKCSKFCQKSIEQIQKVMVSLNREAFLKLSITLIILKFQHCAILSQLQQHQRALQLCKSNLVHITNYLQMLYIFVTQSLKLHDHRRKSGETVHFSRQVYKFAQNILRQLTTYIQQPMLKKQEMVFYYWQKNPQKNQEQLKKKFIPVSNQNCKRSILGVSKTSHWIEDFNIGTIMHMAILDSKQMQNIFPIDEYVFKDKLYQISIYCSMCYFTMATQTRFIESNLVASLNGSQNDKQNKDKDKDKEKDKIMKKYGYVTKSDLFKQSQVYHLCSIDIMSRVIKSSIPYINHIIKSYQKHYIKEKKLQQICSIPQQSITQINQTILEYKPNDKYDKSKVSFAQRHKNMIISNNSNNSGGTNNILTSDLMKQKQETFSTIMKKNPFQCQEVLDQKNFKSSKQQQKKQSLKSSSNNNSNSYSQSEQKKTSNININSKHVYMHQDDQYLKSILTKKKSKGKLVKVKTQQRQKQKKGKVSTHNYNYNYNTIINTNTNINLTKQKKKIQPSSSNINTNLTNNNNINRQKSPTLSNHYHQNKEGVKKK